MWLVFSPATFLAVVRVPTDTPLLSQNGIIFAYDAKTPFMKHLLILPFFALIFIAGCGIIDRLTQFNVSYETDLVIGSGSVINLPFIVQTPDVTTNSELVFASNNTSANRLDMVQLREARLDIKSPEGKNFNFLKSIEVNISAEGLPQKRVAYKYNHTNDNTASITLNVDDVELKEYIKKDRFKIISSVTTDELLTQDVVVTIHTKFFVKARLLGK